MTCTCGVLNKGSGPGEGSWAPVGAGFPGLCCRLLAPAAPGHRGLHPNGAWEASPCPDPRPDPPALTPTVTLTRSPRSVWAEAAGTVSGQGRTQVPVGLATERRCPRGTGHGGSGWS